MPINPIIGDCYIDTRTGICYIWIGNIWSEITDSRLKPSPKDYSPTEEQLEKSPALKSAWEEYLVIKKLLGV